MRRLPPPPLSAPAVITGGSSGIGFAMARQFVTAGRPVVLVARDVARLTTAEALLRGARPAAGIFTIAADVTDATAMAETVNTVHKNFGSIGYAIASAGLAMPGMFAEQPLDDHIRQMAVNYFGALHFARVAVPVMAEGGRLLFVSSCAALHGIYGYSSYAPSKFALRGLADVLRVELAGQGISVSIAYPPNTDTQHLAAEATTEPEATKHIVARAGVYSPTDVAEAILRAADQGRFAVTLGWQLRLLLTVQDLLGPSFRGMQLRIVRTLARRS
jgi:3-dehydrosphinganine reductase